MNIYIARQARFGFGTISVMTVIHPKEVAQLAAPIIADLEKTVVVEESSGKFNPGDPPNPELVISICLRFSLDEVKRLLKDMPTEEVLFHDRLEEEVLCKVRLICENVLTAFHGIS